MSKTARWLDLIAFLLQHRFSVTRETIYEHVADFRRDLKEGKEPDALRQKFERDKKELRELGIHIETVELPQAAGDEPSIGYRLRPADFYLPYLQVARERPTSDRPYPSLRTLVVSERDLAILDRATRRLAERMEFPLAKAAASARRKLAFDLPLSLDHVERILGAQLTPEGAGALAVLQEAVARRIAVRCQYYSIGRDVEGRRVLHPYGLFFNWGRWYCVAGGREYRGWKVFRVDRVREAELVDGSEPQFEPPVKFSVRNFLGRPPWRLSEGRGQWVRVRFAFPESRWVLAQGLGEPSIPMTEDAGAEIRFEVVDENPFLRWLLTFRKHAEILEPEDMKAKLTRLRKRVSALYEKRR
jgi:predicted DNA-binding transcriptional regulator YafY